MAWAKAENVQRMVIAKPDLILQFHLVLDSAQYSADIALDRNGQIAQSVCLEIPGPEGHAGIETNASASKDVTTVLVCAESVAVAARVA